MCIEAAIKIAHMIPLVVEALPLLTLKYSAVPFPRPEIGTYRDSRLTFVSVSRGDCED